MSVVSTAAERQDFLTHLVAASLEILHKNEHLSETQNFANFCSFLRRLSFNFSLQELVQLESFAPWFDAVANFTVESLKRFWGTPGSVTHLISLWERMVTSLNEATSEEARRLVESRVFEVVRTYISSRMESVRAARTSETEDTLEEAELVRTQLNSFYRLCQLRYNGTYGIVKRWLTPLSERMNLASSREMGIFVHTRMIASDCLLLDAAEFAIVEGETTWVVYIIGSLITERTASAAPDEVREPHHLFKWFCSQHGVVIVNCWRDVRRHSEGHHRYYEASIGIYLQGRKKNILRDDVCGWIYIVQSGIRSRGVLLPRSPAFAEGR